MPVTQLVQSGHALSWQLGTVEDIVVRTHRVTSFFLRLPSWGPYVSGQHVDIRLTASDGYQGQRSYSIASAPETDDLIMLKVCGRSSGTSNCFRSEVSYSVFREESLERVENGK